MGVSDAGRSRDVTCDEILAAYSDYVDGLLPPHEAAKVQWHLGSCAACARYDRVVRRGADLARELPPILPSEDFAERLQHRLYHVRDGAAIADGRAAGIGAAGSIAVAGVIALLAWSPVLIEGAADAVAEFGAMAAEDAWQPRTLAADDAAGPDVWPGSVGLMSTVAPAYITLDGNDAVRVLSAVPGPYSPLVVEPPVHRTVRTISIE